LKTNQKQELRKKNNRQFFSSLGKLHVFFPPLISLVMAYNFLLPLLFTVLFLVKKKTKKPSELI